MEEEVCDRSKFTFVTYNLDARQHNYEERLNSFIAQMKKHSPDIVVVQEGNRLTFEKLLREMGYLGYKRLLPDIMHHRQSGEMIFSKFPISKMQYLNYKLATDNRGLTIAKIDIWGRDEGIWIATSQFDENIAMRYQQLSSIPTIVKFVPANETIIFGGDTRILEYQKLPIPNGWYDAWYEGGTATQKYTLNSDTNLLVPPPFKDRPDRVWVRPGAGSKLVCTSCFLIGQDSQISISAHYGVMVTFEFK